MSKVLRALLILGPALLAASCSRPQDGPPIELKLSLARAKWRAQEELWYRLEIRNLTREPLHLDSFWCDQRYLRTNSDSKQWTYFEVHGPDGRLIEPGFLFYWGFHGQYSLWRNDCGDVLCQQYCNVPLTVHPGKPVIATQSVYAPRRRGGRHMGLADARPPNRPLTPDEKHAYEKLWGEKWGSWMTEPVPGHRALEGYVFAKPGLYRIRAVFNPLSEWEQKELLAGRLRLEDRRLPSSLKHVRFASNVVFFEVVP